MMDSEIKTHAFKQGRKLEIEVVDLQRLTQTNQAQIIQPHRTNFYHIFLFKDCQPVHRVDFLAHQIEPFSLLFIDKERVHQFDKSLVYAGEVLVFTDAFFCTTDQDFKFLRSSILFNGLTTNSTMVLRPSDFQKYMQICAEIAQELTQPADEVQHSLLRNLLHNFLLLSEREQRKQGHAEPSKSLDLDYTRAFREQLELHYAHAKSVYDYAQLLHLTEKRLGQATSKILGKSPKEIIHDRIVLEAKRLLAHTNLSIKEIGQKLGFEDAAYFVRYFKRNTQATPVEFRAASRLQ